MKKIKVLPNRRKFASKGRPVRLSDDIYNLLDKKRSRFTKRLSFDCLLRRVFGLPNRRGEPQPLVEGWLEVNSGKFYLDEADARGAAVIEAARARTKKVKRPLRMREVV